MGMPPDEKCSARGVYVLCVSRTGALRLRKVVSDVIEDPIGHTMMLGTVEVV